MWETVMEPNDNSVFKSCKEHINETKLKVKQIKCELPNPRTWRIDKVIFKCPSGIEDGGKKYIKNKIGNIRNETRDVLRSER